MSDHPKVFKVNKTQLLKVALGLCVLSGLVLLVMYICGFDLKAGAINSIAWIKHEVEVVMNWVRGFGPLAFFIAMGILPVLGFPMLPFSLSAGPLFMPEYGLGWVIVFVMASIAMNLSLSYWMARYALRPILLRLMSKLGYQMPEVARENEFNLAVILRVTPGPPFFVQSYLLGLAGVAFKTYFFVSWTIASLYAVALIVFGDAILHGKGRNAFISLMMFAGIIVGINWLRKRMNQARVEKK